MCSEEHPSPLRAVKFSKKGCHCEESATKPSPDTSEIASQSLAMTLPFRQNLTALPSPLFFFSAAYSDSQIKMLTKHQQARQDKGV
jgi:hypothetical protein